MSEIERLAGSIIVAGLPQDAGVAEFARLEALGAGGIVLFDRNVGSIEETRAFVREARRAIGGDAPALVCVDQEGGRVARLRFRDPGVPSMMALGAADDVELAERAGDALAADLLEIGANVAFAPVLDLALDARSTVIGTRSFGDDPARAARLGAAVVRGMQARGIGATAKHFPGHGATPSDSHRDLPVIDASADVVRARELVPFAAAIGAGVRAVMSAHVVVPNLDPASPATLSGVILTTLLRDELGFTGVAFTDCLQMDAIARGTGTVRGGVLALAAGADALLVSHDLEIAHELRAAIVAAVDAGDVPLARLEQAAARVLALRVSVAGAAGAETAAEASDAPLAIARAATALVRGNPRLDAAQPVTVVSFEGEFADGIARSRSERPSLGLALRHRRYRAEVMRVPLEPDDGAVALLIDVLRAQGERALVVVARRAHLHPLQRTAIEALVAFARHAIVVSALEPFDVPVLEAAATLVCSFGDEAANVGALADMLAGIGNAHGTFPVALSSEPSRRLLTEAEIDARLPGRGRPRSLAGDAPGDDAEAGGA